MMIDENLNVLIKIIEDTLEINSIKKNIEIKDKLKNLGLNSISFIKLLVKIEEKFGIEIDDEYLDANKINTVGEIYNLILSKI